MEKAHARKLWLIVAFALLLTAFLVFLSGRRSAPQVPVADVVRQNLSSEISTNGKVEPVSPQSLRATFPTFVEKVYATEGQQVKRGQLLYVLDDKSVRAELDQARADLASEEELLRAAKSGGRIEQVAQAAADLLKAQASRDQLRRDNQALTKLVAQKAATPEELERNRVALVQAEAEVQSLEKVRQSIKRQAEQDTERLALLVGHSRNRIRDLEQDLRSAHATSPTDGTLYSLPAHAGDFVKQGDLLAEIADLHHLRVRAFIDEPELGQIAPNQDVEIYWDAYPERVWNGRTEILPKQVVARGSRNVGELLCSVSNTQLDLLPNTTVDVRIQVSERKAVLVVPRGAVTVDDSRRFVYRAEGDRLHRTEVKVGIANPTMIEVISGLHEGDVVALPGEAQLRDDMRIQAVPSE
jgi:HlyD family secretion protein